MNAGVIGYLNSKNIGDYVQTLSVINLINQDYTILERERLNNYKGKETKTIINGWFMENPLKFPPSKHIDPIFISFHINPSIEKEFLNPKTIDYLKQYQPIGCRDKYTLNLLKRHNIETYFSSCVTLTLKKQDFMDSSYKEKRILIIGAFDRLKPSIRTSQGVIKTVISFIKWPYKFFNYQFKNYIFRKWLNNQNYDTEFFNQIVEEKISSHSEGIEKAKSMLKKIANSEIVITSRIHSALPAVAMDKKVIFIDEGLEHINHKSRLSGLTSFFKSIKLKEIRMLNLDSISVEMKHKSYSKDIEEKIITFLNT